MRPKIVEEDFEQIARSKLHFEQFKKKTILISGASGMIGGYLSEFFLYLNEVIDLKTRVIAIARNQKKAKKRFSYYKNRVDLDLIIQDIIDPVPIDKVDYIIHAASQASPKYFGVDPAGTILPNVIGTWNLLELARLKHAQFLFISSSEVYGELKKNQIPTGESDWGVLDPTSIRSCYAESKRIGETMCNSWFFQYGVNTKIVRPFHIYGPGMDLADGRVFADFTRNIIENKNMVLTSDGQARRSFCYLADALSAFLTVITAGKAGEIFNVGNSEEEVSIKTLAQKMIRLFPEKKLKVVVDKRHAKKGYIASNIQRSCPNVSRIRNLGWSPTHAIESGFKRTILTYL